MLPYTFLRLPILIVFCSSLSWCAKGQNSSIWQDYNLLLEHNTNFEGGQNQIIFQDSRGFIWGTSLELKLNRFDGYSIELFNPDPNDPFSESGCNFWGDNFFEDSQGQIWFISPELCVERYDPATDRFEQFKGRMIDLAKEDKLAGTRHYIYEDAQHNIWIATNVGLYKYSLESKELIFYKTSNRATLVFEDHEKNIWANFDINNRNQYLAKLDESTGNLFDRIDLNLPIIIPSYFNRYDNAAFLKEKDKWLLLVNSNLFLFDPSGQGIEFFPNPPFYQNNWPHSLHAKNEIILLGTKREELYQFLPNSLEFKKCPFFQGRPLEKAWGIHGLITNDGVLFIHLDTVKLKLLKKQVFFERIQNPKDVMGYKRNIHQAGAIFPYQGHVYYNTQRGPIAVRPSSQKTASLDLSIQGVKNHMNVIYQFKTDHNDNLWVAAQWNQDGKSHLLFRQIDQNGNINYQFTCNGENKNCKPANWRLDYFTTDYKGNIWLGSQGSIAYFDPENSSFIHHFISDDKGSLLFGNRINCITVDRDNELWLGTKESGLLRFNPETNAWDTFNYGASGNDGNEKRVHSIFQDSKGDIWIGTGLALIRLDKSTGQYKRYTKKELLTSLPICKIFEDHNQNLWIADNFYIIEKYLEEEDRFIPFDKIDGIEESAYFNQEVFRDSQNYIYFSSSHSEIPYFHPDSFKIDSIVPNIYFTNLQLDNQTIKTDDSTDILQKSIDFTEEITLKYDQNDFTIHYTAPEYLHPNETTFSIQLEGFNDNWQHVGTKREARYTNLSPGTYNFKVKVRNHHGFWSKTPRSLKIVVLPPWYRTWLAYALWTVIILGSIYWFYRFQLNRKLADSEALRLKKLDQAKSRLYTNITHEFRTPLTVILGMIDQVRKDPENWFNEGTRLIRRNGKQLLNLVNQLLDLSKLESGNIKLNLINDDIYSFLQYLTESFHSYADSKDIRMHFISDLNNFHMDYDQEKLQNVISNLLSNAIKFTPAGGNVYVIVQLEKEEKKSILLQVKDDGMGISPEHLPHVFDRFYQVDDSHTRRGEGTGIGLALVRELVNAMGGTIEVESKVKKGTSFSILLPITKQANKMPQESIVDLNPSIAETILLDTTKKLGISKTSQSNRNLVLLVEDNEDVLTFLTSFLSNEYQIITAMNGQEGINIAIEIIPDIIVCDVMMPEKDGFEVCAALKSDERTSHIPIILLTAKSDQDSKIEGLVHGADAYIAKPFNRDELLVRMEKMIALRRQLQEKYQKTGNLRQLTKKTAHSKDEIFLQKVFQVIEENMKDENFGMPQLCKELYMGRSNLFRKLKALTNKSATNLIRSIRLEKGKELLETTDMNVSEVSFEVGFNSPNYFSRVFQEEFGMQPSTIQKS